MKALAELRQRRHLSQRDLAAKASVSFRGLQLLEQTGHNWRVITLARVAEALGLPGQGVALTVDHFLRVPVDSVRDVSLRIVLHGFESWKTHLFNFVDALRSTQNSELIREPPIADMDVRLQALCASVTETIAHELHMTPPPWCAGIPHLDRPWFVAGVENLKAMALVESPAWFRARNIFVLGNFLERA